MTATLKAVHATAGAALIPMQPIVAPKTAWLIVVVLLIAACGLLWLVTQLQMSDATRPRAWRPGARRRPHTELRQNR